MARPHGFDHFCKHLRGLENQYVIIGGGAASILLEDQQLEFRATKDVDLVVLIRSDELNKRILSYVKEGLYLTREATPNLPKYYRFTKPQKHEYPHIIEIFSRNELELELEKDQHIIPVYNQYAEQLSAILLDDEYFDLIRENLTLSVTGIPYINSVANICLKARAYREMSERKLAGDKNFDEQDRHKHLKDIWRIAATLKNNKPVVLSTTVAQDIDIAIQELEKLPERQFKQVMEKIPGSNRVSTMTLLKEVFLAKKK